MTPAPHHRRPNPPATLLGRPASSFTAAELDALPLGTSFGVPGATAEDSLSFNRTPKGWADMFGTETSASMVERDALVCIAVGEPEVLGVERPDDIDALTTLDTVLPRPTRSLREIAEAASAPLLAPRVIDLPPRAARISAADMEEPLELVYRLRRWCGRTGAEVSLLVSRERAQMMFVGDAKPDLVDAVQVGGHRQHTDAAGTVTIWRAS